MTIQAGCRVAIMQPYFLPYAGYFRLFAACDLFVIFDCVQFPRRGWVHRNRLIDAQAVERWLTLHLKRAPQQTLIQDLRFATDADIALERDLRRFPMLSRLPEAATPVIEALRDVRGTPVDYIERLLERVVLYLDLPWNVVRSSSLDVPHSLRGQDRIIEILRRLGARSYVNAPGGHELYDEQSFQRAGLSLRFLPDYTGPRISILSQIATMSQMEMAQKVRTAIG